jgi:surface antigen
VAFAKEDAGIEIRGNARDWWSRAAGVYERGSRPEPGSVLSFRETGRMPLGHVAVVSATLDDRTIVIDQSHWNSRGITRDIEVKDVSEDNDWSLVRVQLGHGREFGSIYPTHGFIYPRPYNTQPTPDEEIQPATAFRPSTLTHYHSTLEVAEAPMNARPLDLSVNGIATDAPYRAWR